MQPRPSARRHIFSVAADRDFLILQFSFPMAPLRYRRFRATHSLPPECPLNYFVSSQSSLTVVGSTIPNVQFRHYG